MRLHRNLFALLLAISLAAPLVKAGPGEFQQSVGEEIAPPSFETKDLRALGEKLRGLLRDELTRLWYPRSVDRDHGGFHQNYARDWSPRPDDERSIVYQARMTWTAAAFSRFSPRDREVFEGYARHGIAYLDGPLRDREGGGFHWQVAALGQSNARLGTEKHVYGAAFALYAASEAYGVTKDPKALAVARDAYAWLETHAHDAEHGGYFEALTRDGTPILKSEGPTRKTDRLGIDYGYKTMNSHIHLLEAVAAFFKVEPTAPVKTRLLELLAVVRDRIAVEPGALNLYLTLDWRATPAHDSFGHDVETAYLLVDAAEVLGIPGDPPTWKVARALIDHALERGWDAEHGGFYDKGDVFGVEPYDKTKVWWTQAEGLNALLLMHKRYKGETDRYGRAFLKQWAFIDSHLIDPIHGGWFMETTREGKLLGDGRKATPWKAAYHTSRALMNVVTMLDELTGGR